MTRETCSSGKAGQARSNSAGAFVDWSRSEDRTCTDWPTEAAALGQADSMMVVSCHPGWRRIRGNGPAGIDLVSDTVPQLLIPRASELDLEFL